LLKYDLWDQELFFFVFGEENLFAYIDIPTWLHVSLFVDVFWNWMGICKYNCSFFSAHGEHGLLAKHVVFGGAQHD
jgi:hypothetical protein